ncbi:MATE family efflux transporter [Paracoccaceae bacterium GXU_MW_L88]
MSQARFTTGSTMRHVMVMTLTGSIGLMFTFLVDAATLFWVGQLQDEVLIAALGYAGAVQFFTVSSGIGLMIGALTLVSRALGQGKRDEARRTATVAMILTMLVQAVVAGLVVVNRDALLGLFGASGAAAEAASHFLLITVPSLPIMAVGMTASAVLRAEGDATGAMYTTLIMGATAMVLDPLLIIYLDLGIIGAAVAMVISRSTSVFVGLWLVVRKHDLAAKPRLGDFAPVLRPYFVIAGPALLTQMSTPFGNAVLTRAVAEFGDSAVAGWTVVLRLTTLAFGGIFALSGAIGGIVGQNYGAALMERVRSTYRDALIFAACYTLIAWAIMASITPWIVSIFHLSGEGAEVLRAFTHIGAGGFIFVGALFCSNAAFNTLGRPLFSTAANWFRDGILMAPAVAAMTAWFAAPGAVYGQAIAGGLAGLVAALWGWHYINNLEAPVAADPEGSHSYAPTVSAGKAAAALPLGHGKKEA